MLVKFCSRDLARILQILTCSLGKTTLLTLLEPRLLYSSQLIVQTLFSQWQKSCSCGIDLSLQWPLHILLGILRWHVSVLLDANICPELLRKQVKFCACTSPGALKALIACVHRTYLCVCSTELAGSVPHFSKPSMQKQCWSTAFLVLPWHFLDWCYVSIRLLFAQDDA